MNRIDSVNQIIDALKELDAIGLATFQRRYANFMGELTKNRTNEGKKKYKPKIISKKEKENRHQRNLQKTPPGWSTLPNGRTINAKKGQKLPQNMPTSEKNLAKMRYANKQRAIVAAIKERESN